MHIVDDEDHHEQVLHIHDARKQGPQPPTVKSSFGLCGQQPPWGSRQEVDDPDYAQAEVEEAGPQGQARDHVVTIGKLPTLLLLLFLITIH